MPRAPDGSYSLPAGTIVNTGDTILTSQHNPAMNDIAAALSASLDRDGLGGMRASLSMGGNLIHNVSPGVAPDDVVTLSQLSGVSGMPVGTIVDFAGSVAPDGWLICGGQSLVRADYAALFAVIGTTYGSSSGTTFNLPDCRGRVSAGRDFDQGGVAGRLTSTMSPNGTTLGATGGAQTVTLTSDEMPSHTHTGSTASSGSHSHTAMTGSSALANLGTFHALVVDSLGATSTDGAHTHTMNLDNTGGGGAHANVQPTILFNKLIKAS